MVNALVIIRHPQVKQLLSVIQGEMSRKELQTELALQDRKSFTNLYLYPAIKKQLIEMTIPDRPRSRLQKYRLTEMGKSLVKERSA